MNLRTVVQVTFVLAFLVSGLPATAEPKPGDEYPGGKVHVCTTQADGVSYRAELQFFKSRHGGQVWKSVGRDKAGRIYLGDSSHGSNAYVYRLDPNTGRFRYLGDVLGNIYWGVPGGPDNGKIHSNFVEGPDGGVYFLSHYGRGGPIRHGGHLWRLDPRTDRIADLGVPMPGNTNFCLSDIDRERNVVYTVSTPAGYLIRYDLKTGAFTALAATGMGGVRYLPMDNAGNIYMFGEGEIRRYSPETGRLERVVEGGSDPLDDRTLGSVGAFCWGKDRKRLYLLRYEKASLFRWDVGSPKVEFLGKLHPQGRDLYCNNLHVDAAESRLYSIGAAGKRAEKGLYVLELASGKGRKLWAIDDVIEEELEGKVRSRYAYVDFHDHGGVTGDDGTMYTGFFGGGRDQDLDPGGLLIAALLAIRVSVKE